LLLSSAPTTTASLAELVRNNAKVPEGSAPPAGPFIQGIRRDGPTTWSIQSTDRSYVPLPRKPQSCSHFRIDASGRVRKDSYCHTLPEVAEFTSAVDTDTTLAVTTALSHAVSLIAVVIDDELTRSTP
jgi:hypothetical protein